MGFRRALALLISLVGLFFSDGSMSRGPNSCVDRLASIDGRACCRGWSALGESRLCVKPLCKSDCGSGSCVSPNRCWCSDGTLRVSCSGVQSDHGREPGGNSALATGQAQRRPDHTSLARGLHKGQRNVDTQADCKGRVCTGGDEAWQQLPRHNSGSRTQTVMHHQDEVSDTPWRSTSEGGKNGQPHILREAEAMIPLAVGGRAGNGNRLPNRKDVHRLDSTPVLYASPQQDGMSWQPMHGRSDAIDLAVKGKANDLYVLARMAVAPDGDSDIARVQGMSSDSAKIQQIAHKGRSEIAHLPSVVGPLFSAGKPRTPPIGAFISNVPFSTASPYTDEEPYPDVARDDPAGVADSALSLAKPACSQGAERTRAASPCGQSEPASQTPCASEGCSSCKNCLNPDNRLVVGYPNLAADVCSPGYQPVSEGNLIVCVKIPQAVVSAVQPCINTGCASSNAGPCQDCLGSFGLARPLESAILEPIQPGFIHPIQEMSPGTGFDPESFVSDCEESASGCLSQRGNACSAKAGTSCSGANRSCQFLTSLGIRHRGCNEEKSAASSSPECLHGTLSARDESCECQQGFWGERCDKDLDECAAGLHSCQYGCFNTIGSFKCVCAPGTQPEDGDTCYVRPCPQCLHGGQCADGRCVCPPGFHGRLCERDVDECKDGNHSCSQICRNTFGGHVCLCRSGYRLLSDNRTCEERKCKHHCLNGGECVKNRCACPEGFVGVACQFESKRLSRTQYAPN